MKLKSKPPICVSCLFDKQQKRPWHSKGKHSSIRSDEDDVPGHCVLIDQIVLKQPGLIPRMEGGHTRERISGATTFVDHTSNLNFVHLHVSAMQEETIAAKKAFEKFADGHRVQIKNYRADNGRFSELGFKNGVE